MPRILVFSAVFIVAAIILVAAGFLSSSSVSNVLDGLNDAKKYSIAVGDAPLLIHIADTEAKRSKGLSGTASLPHNEGLLFVFNEIGQHSFWMRDMRFPIDIIWIDERFIIVDITENILPATFPEIFESAEPVKFVLEVNAGWAAKNSIKRGVRIDGLESLSP